jgi:hypothetical protein
VFVTSFKKCRVSNTLDDTEGDYCLQKLKVWTITIIIACVIIVMDILGNFMTSRNFILHYLFVELSICEFYLQM